MIYVNSYSAALDAAIQNYTSTYLTPLSNYTITEDIPTDLIQLLKHEKVIISKLNQITSVRIQPLSFDAKSNVESYYKGLKAKEEQKRIGYINEAETKKRQLQQQHIAEINEINKYNSDLVEPVKEKHNELISRKNDLQVIFKHYDISPLDMDISDNVTQKEFMTLIDESISICDKYKSKSKTYFDRLVKPLKGESNLSFTLCYVLLIAIVVYFTLPILSIPVFILLFMSVHNMYKDLEKLRIACSLMSQIDYKRFIPKEEFREIEELDLSFIDDELADKLSTIVDYTEQYEEAIKSLTVDTKEITKKCTEAQTVVSTEYAKVSSALTARLHKVQEIIQDYMKDYVTFPYAQNESIVMSHKYTLGRLEGKLGVIGELPCKNIVFDSTNRELAISNMKLYLANALLSVRVKQLTVEIYDPKNMCGDFTEFFTNETKPYIKPNMMKLDELIKTYREYSQNNIVVLDGKSIDDYNREAEEQEMTPKEYKLLLIISEFDKLEKGDDKETFIEYFKFSAESGVMIWLLDNKKYANSLWVDGSYSLEGQGISYTRELGKEAVDTFTKSLANYVDKGIDYATKFGDVYIPREKWWTWDTIHGINMHYGLENGDPTRGVPMVIGDTNVHALLGGATGAGKSAAINQLLISLITMYPPSELQLVLIDFKNVEAAKFTRGYDKENNRWMSVEEEKKLREQNIYYSRVSRIPHLRIISGTTDGEYALSVFEFLMNEMARRQEIINKFGVTKIEEMRVQILKSYNKEFNKNATWADMRKDWDWYKPNIYDKYGDLPRILVIFDEFQVMFNTEFVPQKIIDTINGKITAITKLARAMSTHFWFTSQSMKGTMPKDTMANFSLRGALRCTADVSEELIGNPAASTITAKFGYMYTNDSAGENKDANRKWRVPFLHEAKIPMYIDTINDMLEEFNEKHLMAEFYDEKILVPSDEITSWYTNYPESFSDPNTFILGERASFSTNKAPVTITLQEDGGENILLSAFDKNDMLNLTMTLIDNLKQANEEAILIINCQDKETHTMLDVENLIDESFYPLSLPKQDITEFIDAMNATVTGREERGGKQKPMYVFCIQWERAPSISVDINYKLGDKFKDILRRGPSVGVHFVFCCRDKLDMQRYIPAACNHRIAGMIPKDSFFFIENSAVEKLPTAAKDAGLFAIYEFGTTNHKFRIYQHKFTKTIKSREVVIE